MMIARRLRVKRLLDLIRGRKTFMSTPTTASTVICITNPFEHNIDAESAFMVPPPLIDAIRSLPKDSRPTRIVSHETDDGRAFNCAYFEDAQNFRNYRDWFAKHALSSTGSLYEVHEAAFQCATEVPNTDTWLWGLGHSTLSDTRSGEYHVGMGTRYSRMIFHDAMARVEAENTVLTPAFEERLQSGMDAAGINYLGRLVMIDESGGGWFTTTRYGSVQDAAKGTAAVRMLLAEEISRWFTRYETITGSVASTWSVTSPPRDVDG